mmetsp:Transcript_45391/g.145641  ORF Transcript_45391/g.145641 Transcript_45391/m.145641 type:complete len:330 (+) Transcript_45391:124-1113(+)
MTAPYCMGAPSPWHIASWAPRGPSGSLGSTLLSCATWFFRPLRADAPVFFTSWTFPPAQTLRREAVSGWASAIFGMALGSCFNQRTTCWIPRCPGLDSTAATSIRGVSSNACRCSTRTVCALGSCAAMRTPSVVSFLGLSAADQTWRGRQGAARGPCGGCRQAVHTRSSRAGRRGMSYPWTWYSWCPGASPSLCSRRFRTVATPWRRRSCTSAALGAAIAGSRSSRRSGALTSGPSSSGTRSCASAAHRTRTTSTVGTASCNTTGSCAEQSWAIETRCATSATQPCLATPRRRCPSLLWSRPTTWVAPPLSSGISARRAGQGCWASASG